MKLSLNHQFQKILLFILIFSYCINVSAGERIKVVSNKTELLAAVSPGSPYTKVYVKGEIPDLTNVQLKEHLTLAGFDTNSKLVAIATVPKSDLLIVSKNNKIENITLIIPDFSGTYAIRNINGFSTGMLDIDHVITNGEISINIADGSRDSIVTITNTKISLNNAPATLYHVAAGVDIMTEHNSLLSVQAFNNNKIEAFGMWNMGIFSHAYSNSTIEFNKNISNNIVITQGKQSHAIYNFANGAVIHFKDEVSDNTIETGMLSNGIYNNTAHEGRVIIQNGINHNTISTSGIISHGIANQSQTNGKVSIFTGIQNNLILTTSTSSNGFFNCAGWCDTNGDIFSGGNIDLSQASIINNKMTTTYDNTSTVENIANGSGAHINFGMGSTDAIENILTQKNSLDCPDDAKPVYNHIANGGLIN